MKSLLGFVLLNSILLCKVKAQIDTVPAPEIGKKFEGFKIHDEKNNAFFRDTLREYKGKYLILDFFAADCAGCFVSFPHIKEFQTQFRDSLQFVLFGRDDEHIRGRFEPYRKNTKLNLPYVYDSAFVNYAVPLGFPHLIWIDPAGIVKAITHSRDLTKANLIKFINGENFQFENRSASSIAIRSVANPELRLKNFDWSNTTDSKGNTVERIDIDTNCLFKSEVGKWKQYMTWDPIRFRTSGPNANQALAGTGSLKDLFLFAYVGKTIWMFTNDKQILDTSDIYYKFYPKIEIDVEDSTFFFGQWPNEGNLYWYRLIMKRNDMNEEMLRHQMQNDLSSFFGYSAHFVSKQVDCYYLEAEPGAEKKLKSKGGDPELTFNTTDIVIKNQPMAIFSNVLLRSYLAAKKNRDLYFDTTGISCNVDIKLTGSLYELDDVRTLLREYGLKIVEGKKEMYVLKIERSKGQANFANLNGSTHM